MMLFAAVVLESTQGLSSVRLFEIWLQVDASNTGEKLWFNLRTLNNSSFALCAIYLDMVLAYSFGFAPVPIA